MREVAQKFVSTPLFSFQILKLNAKDIIAVLKDTLEHFIRSSTNPESTC
jgi:hypothetical protein